MPVRTAVRASLAATLAASSVALTALAGPAAAAPAPADLGTASLAELLAADGDRFDRDWSDYDILDQSIAAVLLAKPDSPVGILADGTQALTAFIPNDLAFRRFTKDLTGVALVSEPQVIATLVDAVGVDTVESVLLYHVVPGVTIDSTTALASDGAELATANGASVTVDVVSVPSALIRLIDQDPTDRNPFLLRDQLDLNEGNRQIAHGIPLVLRPADL